MELLLVRTYYKEGTNGALFINRKHIGFTIELPWVMNIHEKSCIPEGRYCLNARFSNKFQHHLAIDRVANRSLILLRPSNNANIDLKGSIAPVSYLTGVGRGLYSKPLLDKLLSFYYQASERKETFDLIITSYVYDFCRQI